MTCIVVVSALSSLSYGGRLRQTIIILVLYYYIIYLSTTGLFRNTLECGKHICMYISTYYFKLFLFLYNIILYICKYIIIYCVRLYLKSLNLSRFDDHVVRFTQHHNWYMKRYLTTNHLNLWQVILWNNTTCIYYIYYHPNIYIIFSKLTYSFRLGTSRIYNNTKIARLYLHWKNK
jgi:hypothetical protein